MAEWLKLLGCLPKAPHYAFDWDGLAQTALQPLFKKLAQVPQNPEYHGEGDVWTHTCMVCEALVQLSAFRALPERQQQEIALAAILHDIGKIPATKWEDGKWTSPHHSSTGAQMARELLWKEYQLCGTPEKQQFRETVCFLIRYHMTPSHLLDHSDPARRAVTLAANGQLCPDFTLALLCLLAEADTLGRMAPDTQELLEKVQLCAEAAHEAGCLHQPAPFASQVTQHAYLNGRNVWPMQELFDDCWGEVILLSGLPGTGKDTWISKNHPKLPVVCLDDIRREMNIGNADNQGPVVQAAMEQARVYLRAHQPFIWNATCISPMKRQKQLRLFEQYGARAHIVYLETAWEENLRRNSDRKAAVPEGVIVRMLSQLIPPERIEAQTVEWKCT